MPSNRNQATYFELRLAEEVCLAEGLPFNYRKELEESISRISLSHGGKAKALMLEQESRLKIGLPVFLKKVTENEIRLGTNLTNVEWIGGTNQGVRVADLDLWHDKTRVPVSAKSVRSGNGTERNLGASELNRLIGYDAGATQLIMLQESISVLESKYPKVNFGATFPSLNAAIDSHPDADAMKLIAKKVGHKYQSVFSNEILDTVRAAPKDKIQNFIEYVGLQNSPEDNGLQIFVNRSSMAFFKVPPHDLRAADFELIPLASSKKSAHEGKLKGVSTWTFQVNATNGLGISTIAYRAFIR